MTPITSSSAFTLGYFCTQIHIPCTPMKCQEGMTVWNNRYCPSLTHTRTHRLLKMLRSSLTLSHYILSHRQCVLLDGNFEGELEDFGRFFPLISTPQMPLPEFTMHSLVQLSLLHLKWSHTTHMFPPWHRISLLDNNYYYSRELVSIGPDTLCRHLKVVTYSSTLYTEV